MKIAAISDSHIPRRAKQIPEKIKTKLDGADVVVHAGDLEEVEVLNRLEDRFDTVEVARGNNDPHDLPPSSVIQADNLDIGVYHGAGITPRGDLDTLLQTAQKMEVDILVTGHTHQQRTVKHGGKLIVNPGTCTGARGGTPAKPRPTTFSTIKTDGSVTVKQYTLDNGGFNRQTKVYEL